MFKKQIVILSLGVLILILGGAAYSFYYWKTHTGKGVICTLEAKQCPDGSYVGRSAPNCQFAACPVVKTEEEVSCGKKYQTDILEINGTDAVKRIIALRTKAAGKCEFNIAGANIGIAKKVSADGKIYDIVLYDKADQAQSKDPFNQSVEIYRVDLNANTLSMQSQFDGRYEVLGKFKDETTDWRTYRNEEPGFEIKYPDNWFLNYKDKLENSNAVITLTSPLTRKSVDDALKGNYLEGYASDILLYTIEGQTSIDSYLKDQISKSGYDPYSRKEKFKFKGYDAYKATEGGFGASFVIFIQKDKLLYKIIFGLKEQEKDLNKIEKQILSSFNFINKDETTDWQTYRNKEYGFEVKYPQKWKLSDAYENILGALERIFFSDNNNNNWLNIDIYDNSAGLSLDQYLAKNHTKNNAEGVLETKKNIFVGGVNGIQINDFGNTWGYIVDDEYIFLAHNKQIIQIQFAVDNSITILEQRKEIKDILNQILSTFKFIK